MLKQSKLQLVYRCKTKINYDQNITITTPIQRSEQDCMAHYKKQ